LIVYYSYKSHRIGSRSNRLSATPNEAFESVTAVDARLQRSALESWKTSRATASDSVIRMEIREKSIREEHLTKLPNCGRFTNVALDIVVSLTFTTSC
jgi:hypothetical protein